MDKDDHPELDDSALLDATGTKEHQSLIGALQWHMALGRFDIMCSVMIMSRFRVGPRQGHLDCLSRIFGCLRKQPEAKT